MTWIVNLYPCITKWVLLTKLCAPDLGEPARRAGSETQMKGTDLRPQCGEETVGQVEKVALTCVLCPV